jgi:hypothetical protein
MAETVLEKESCNFCGIDVRENTAFCYNCGKPVGENAPAAPATPVVEDPIEKGIEMPIGALDEHISDPGLKDLAERLKREEEDAAKLTEAANKRRKSRSQRSKVKGIVWEPVDDSDHKQPILFTALILVISALAVFLAVYIK